MADGEIRIEITGDARDLTREVARVKGSLDDLGKRAGGLGDTLKGAFASAAGFLAANVIQAGIGAITQGIGTAINKAAELETELNFLQAVTGATGDQMAKVSQLAKQLGADVTIPAASALDAAKAMTELAKAGLSVEQSMAAAKGTLQLAAAGQLDAARAAEIVAGALNAFKLSGDQAVRVADLLSASANASAADVTDMADSLKMASAVAAMSGQSIEDTIAALSMMANAGIKGSDAGTSLKVMLMRLLAPTEDAEAMLAALGITIYDAQGRMLPLRDIIAQFSEKLAEGASRVIKTNAVTDKMAKEAAKAADAVDKLQDRLESQRRRLGVLNEELKHVIAKYGEGSLQAIRKRNAIAELEAAIARTESKMSKANATVENFARLSGTTTESVVKMTQAERNRALALIFGTDAVRAANIILMAGTEAYDQMVNAVTKANAAQDLAAARTRGLAGAQEALENATETLSIALGEGLLPALTNAGFTLAETLTKPETVAFVERLGSAIGGALTEAFTLVRDAASKVDINAIFDALKMGAQEVQGVFKPVTDAVGGIVSGVKPALDELGGQILLIGQSVIMHIQGAFTELGPVVKDVLGAAGELLNALKPAIVAVAEALKPIVTLIGNALISAIRTFVSVLREALEFLSNTIKAIAALLRGDVDGFVRYAGEAFRSLGEGIRAGLSGAIQTVAALFGDIGQQILGFISRINDALLNIRNLGSSVVQSISGALSNIRLPQLPFLSGQQSQGNVNNTYNYNLNVQAAQSQGVMNDFDLMRRLGWR